MLDAILRKVWIKMLLSDYFYLIYLFVTHHVTVSWKLEAANPVWTLLCSFYGQMPERMCQGKGNPDIRFLHLIWLDIYVFAVHFFYLSLNNRSINHSILFLNPGMGGAMSVYRLYFQDPNENTAGFISVQNFSLSFYILFWIVIFVR